MFRPYPVELFSRHLRVDRRAGVARMAGFGAQCVTSEMVLFEWLEAAGSDDFKELSELIK